MRTAADVQAAFEFTGGRPCLDFVNTVDSRPTVRRIDLLRTYDDLIAWSRQAGILSGAEAARLSREAVRRPAGAAKVRREMVDLREALYRIFSRTASGRFPLRADLATYNRAVTATLARSEIARSRGEFVWRARDDRSALDPMAWTIVRSALDLLTSAEVRTLRECAANTCGWLFLDTSRNRTRRWCNMKVCGNRDKVRRFRARSR